MIPATQQRNLFVNTSPSIYFRDGVSSNQGYRSMLRLLSRNGVDQYDLLAASLRTKNTSPILKPIKTHPLSCNVPPKKRDLSQCMLEACDQRPLKRARSASSPVQDSSSVESQQLPKVPEGKEGITSFSEHDVLSGRGGATNVHSGNRYFRSLVNAHRDKYLRSKKNDKPSISRSIVNMVRRKNGRFLKKDDKSGLWFEIGDDLAREKTSQALRQRAPDFRRQMLEEDQNRMLALSCSAMSPKPVQEPDLVNRIQYIKQRMNDSQELMLQYLAVKERQNELQYHLRKVRELKETQAQRFSMMGRM